MTPGILSEYPSQFNLMEQISEEEWQSEKQRNNTGHTLSHSKLLTYLLSASYFKISDHLIQEQLMAK